MATKRKAARFSGASEDKEQQVLARWLDALCERGWYAEVCHGAVEAICLLMKIGL